MKTWKLLGLAGLAGVAATGAVVARDERRRQEVTPDDVRERLRARHAALAASDEAADPPGPVLDVGAVLGAEPSGTPGPSRWRRLTRRPRS